MALLFPTRQPRHVAEGAVNLAKSVAAGLSLSIVSLIGLPVAGFRQAGWLGLVAGSLAGAVYGAVFCLLGVANGAYQMARGALETPRALQAARQGLVWDGTTWRLYSFAEEQAQLQETGSGGGTVRDVQYYTLLRVPTDASASQIKRAYYQQARHVHPDKNPDGDPEAFRQLHTAYVTLYDPEKRAQYDRWGPKAHPESGGPSIPELDVFCFFAILFHTSGVVEPYIGDLSIASFGDTVLNAMRTHPTQPEDCFRLLLTGGSPHRQQQRQLDVALYLKNRVSQYAAIAVGGNADDTAVFRNACRTEAAHVAASGPFGVRFAQAIGSALLLEGGQFERAWWTAAWVLMQSNVRSMQGTLSIVRESWDVLKLLTKLRSRTTPKELEVLLPELLDVAWAYNEKDIGTTLRGACMRLFADAKSMKERIGRAQAIQIMGQELVHAAESYGQSPRESGQEDLLVRAEVAYMMAMQVSGTFMCNL